MIARHHAILVSAFAVAMATPAIAAGPLQVVSKVSVETKQRAADGTTRVSWNPTRKAIPGDRMMFTLAYNNTGSQPISGLVLDNPVPNGIAYRGPADGSPTPEVSIDGQAYGALATLHTRAADGTLRAATADDVTHVRWRLNAPVTAGAKGQVSFQAVLK